MDSGNLFEKEEKEESLDKQIILNTMTIIFREIQLGKRLTKEGLNNIFIRSLFKSLNVTINDLVDYIPNCDNSIGLAILNSPEFIDVKDKYMKCSYFKKGYCVVCELYQNKKDELLNYFDDFVEFNMLDHYIALYIYYVGNGEIEDMEKLYNYFKDKHNFQQKNEKAKKKGLKWLISINGEDDEMVRWMQAH